MAFHEPGKIVTAHLSDGKPLTDIDCIETACGCACHDDNPLPAGTYATVRLDREDVRLGLMRVVVLAEDHPTLAIAEAAREFVAASRRHALSGPWHGGVMEARQALAAAVDAERAEGEGDQ